MVLDERVVRIEVSTSLDDTEAVRLRRDFGRLLADGVRRIEARLRIDHATLEIAVVVNGEPNELGP